MGDESSEDEIEKVREASKNQGKGLGSPVSQKLKTYGTDFSVN